MQKSASMKMKRSSALCMSLVSSIPSAQRFEFRFGHNAVLVGNRIYPFADQTYDFAF
jgi:hypothetical protein